MKQPKTIAVAVHVDTYDGMKKGVPVLLDLFRKYGVKATFFVPMGKDHTGWTVKRVFTRKGFLNKSGTGRVWAATTSPKTLMYGLLLPGPEIARRNADLLNRIVKEGQELGIHGYDHVWWHDHIKTLDRERTEEEIDRLLEVFAGLTGVEARSFAAPGWMINAHALRYFGRRGLAYTSDTRDGTCPFYPEMDGECFPILQMPTTLPTLDEVVGSGKYTDADALVDHYRRLLRNDLNILTVHAEIEGRGWNAFLEGFIRNASGEGFAFRRLIDIAEGLKDVSDIPVCPIKYGFVEGRAGEVCLQGVAGEV